MGAGGGAGIAGGVIGAMGQIESGLYSAQVERNNAKIAQQNAARATQAGYQEAENKGLQDANVIGQIIAAQGANNVDSRSGSALAVQGGARAADALDQGTIIHNALMKAYGYQTEAQSDKAQSQQDLTAAAYNAAGSLAGQAGNLPTSTAPADPNAPPETSTFLETAAPTQSSNVLFGYNNNTNYGAVTQ